MTIDLNSVIHSYNPYHCIFRDGFVFTPVTEPANIFDAIVIRSPENCDCWSPKKSFSTHSLKEHIDFINKHRLEKAVIIAEDLRFLKECPTLKYIEIIPADTASDHFDYSPLSYLPEVCYLSCTTRYGGADEPYSTSIDYSTVHGIKDLFVNGQGHLNYNTVNTLETLEVYGDKNNRDLLYLSECTNLKSLGFSSCVLNTFSGINSLKSIEKVSVFNCRTLQDISELCKVASSLKTLSIESCAKLSDFSWLSELNNLEHLYLWGNNELPNLHFLKSMKKLKTFTFSMKILDNDLTPCLDIPYVCCAKNRKEYNLKDKDLPKNLK